jgi:serine protease
VMYPAGYQSWVIGVAATKYNDKNPKLTQLTDYSRYDPGIAVAAPGGQQDEQRILSTRLGGGYALASGTSQATAHVTGAMALALNKAPNVTFAEARNALADTAWDLLGYSGPLQNLKLINVQMFVESLP